MAPPGVMNRDQAPVTLGFALEAVGLAVAMVASVLLAIAAAIGLN